MAHVISKESFTPLSGYFIQVEMSTVVDREDFSVEIDNVDPCVSSVIEYRLVIGWSIASQSFIKCSLDDVLSTLIKVDLVYILRLNCQNAL